MPKAGEKASERKGNGIKMPFTIYLIQPETHLNLGKYAHGIILVILAINHSKSRHARQIRSIFKVTPSRNNVTQEHLQCERRCLFASIFHAPSASSSASESGDIGSLRSSVVLLGEEKKEELSVLMGLRNVSSLTHTSICKATDANSLQVDSYVR